MDVYGTLSDHDKLLTCLVSLLSVKLMTACRLFSGTHASSHVSVIMSVLLTAADVSLVRVTIATNPTVYPYCYQISSKSFWVRHVQFPSHLSSVVPRKQSFVCDV